MATLIKLEHSGPVLEITLDRPLANAIDIAAGSAVKIERLQDISADDCLAEGIPPIADEDAKRVWEHSTTRGESADDRSVPQ